jgi:hypothetical protein
MANRSLDPRPIVARQRPTKIAECDEGNVKNGQIEHKRLTGCLPTGMSPYLAADLVVEQPQRTFFAGLVDSDPSRPSSQ